MYTSWLVASRVGMLPPPPHRPIAAICPAAHALPRSAHPNVLPRTDRSTEPSSCPRAAPVQRCRSRILPSLSAVGGGAQGGQASGPRRGDLAWHLPCPPLPHAPVSYAQWPRRAALTFDDEVGHIDSGLRVHRRQPEGGDNGVLESSPHQACMQARSGPRAASHISPRSFEPAGARDPTAARSSSPQLAASRATWLRRAAAAGSPQVLLTSEVARNVGAVPSLHGSKQCMVNLCTIQARVAKLLPCSC